jgi:putative transposase
MFFMAKYHARFKLKIVKQFLAGPLGGRLVARQHGLPYSMVYRWVARFQLHGAQGLATAHGRYDAAFRQTVLRRMWRDDLSYSEAAARFGVGNASTIARWERRYHAREVAGMSPSRQPRPDHDRSEEVPEARRTGSAQHASNDRRVAGGEREVARPTGASRVFRRLRTLRKKSNVEKAQAVQTLRPRYALDRLLDEVGLPRSTFYHWQRRSAAPDPKAGLKAAVRAIVDSHMRYGYRRVTALLRRKGWVINHKRVQRVMQELGLQVLRRVGKFRSYRGPGHQVIPDRVQRNFTADAPNQRWVTDVTEFAVGGEKCYLSPVMDLYNSEIVAFQIARKPTLNLVQTMVRKAFKKLGKDDAPLLHSDQGWHYQHAAYRRLLGQKGIIQSMSRKGNCLDNAAMESFFGLLKTEFFHPSRFESIAQLQDGIRRYIRYYNHKRITLKLNGLSPVEYRTQAVGV